MIESDEAARLIRAVARNNTFMRGRKSRMEAWKVMFGVYVAVRYKHPVYIVAGVKWKLHFDVEYKNKSRYHKSNSKPAFQLPAPNLYQKADDEPSWQDFSLTFSKFEGSEDSFRHDFTILRMFDSEWKNVPGRSTG